jgi:choice-of-anchor B domain-containing protein
MGFLIKKSVETQDLASLHKINFFTFFLIIINIFSSNNVFAHAEHDKERYVAADGLDAGRCDKKETPCKTISYAARQAGKGDKILVAEGTYEITDVDSIFYLSGSVVPITGGYSVKSYQKTTDSSSKKLEKTQQNKRSILIGVPSEFAAGLAEKGFIVISDTKGLNREQKDYLQTKQKELKAMAANQVEVPCVNGMASSFACNKLDLLAHVNLTTLGNSSSNGNDIWGHVDLNDNREYALMGLTNGVSIVDVTVPTNPQVISFIPSQQTIWRDLKVYQYYDNTRQRWMAYAYVTADAASVGTMILDLNKLPAQVQQVSSERTDLSAHNIYISNVDYTTGVALTGRTPYVHVAGSDKNGGAYNTYSLTNPLAPAAVYKNAANSRAFYSHDVSSLWITDSRRAQCTITTQDCDLMLDYNEDTILLWDKTNAAVPQTLSSTSYQFVSYVHSGWWTDDKQFISVHDELDEQRFNLKTRVRFFSISNLRAPQLVGEYIGPTSAIDHNGYARGNRYYISNYERGLVVLDISNPAQPTEVGFFDTYPINDSAAFNGAWGTYPFLLSGHVLVSDINSGLYVIRDKTVAVQGAVRFTANQYVATEGTSVALTLERVSGSTGAVQVYYETQAGNAESGVDFEAQQGMVEWQDGEMGIKTIQVNVNADTNANELTEEFFVRLYNPRNGLALNSPALTRVNIQGRASLGQFNFDATTIAINETQTNYQLAVTRVGGTGEARLSAEFQTNGLDISSYLSLQNNQLVWADGETGTKNFTLTITNNQRTDGQRKLGLIIKNTSATDTTGQTLDVLVDDGPATAAPKKKSGGGSISMTLTILSLLLIAHAWFLSCGRRINRLQRAST